MTTQPSLFDPATTQPQQCPVCGTWKRPEDPKAAACWVDLNREDYRRRPAGCLNATNPKHQNIPF